MKIVNDLQGALHCKIIDRKITSNGMILILDDDEVLNKCFFEEVRLCENIYNVLIDVRVTDIGFIIRIDF